MHGERGEVACSLLRVSHSEASFNMTAASYSTPTLKVRQETQQTEIGHDAPQANRFLKGRDFFEGLIHVRSDS